MHHQVICGIARAVKAAEALLGTCAGQAPALHKDEAGMQGMTLTVRARARACKIMTDCTYQWDMLSEQELLHCCSAAVAGMRVQGAGLYEPSKDDSAGCKAGLWPLRLT
jgi:hypothetical protein